MVEEGTAGARDGAGPLRSHRAKMTGMNVQTARINLAAVRREHRPCHMYALILFIILLLRDWNRILQFFIRFLLNLTKTLPAIFSIALKSVPNLWTSSNPPLCYSYLGNMSSHLNSLCYEPRCPFEPIAAQSFATDNYLSFPIITMGSLRTRRTNIPSRKAEMRKTCNTLSVEARAGVGGTDSSHLDMFFPMVFPCSPVCTKPEVHSLVFII